MNQPIYYRKSIPFFHDKTAIEFQKDNYERYDEMVIRQSALHLADEIWGMYPMQKILDFAQDHYPKLDSESQIVELGCAVGRWIANLAKHYPQANCWGIDYSYQMLKRAHEFWVKGKDISIDLSNKGFPQVFDIQASQLKNLQFGLAKVEQLPFADQSQDLVLNSFLLDRLDDPIKGLNEMYRILKQHGKLILISPLNFQQAAQWAKLYPASKIRDLLNQLGFKILDWTEDLIIREPLDARGNLIEWKCLALVAKKNH